MLYIVKERESNRRINGERKTFYPLNQAIENPVPGTIQTPASSDAKLQGFLLFGYPHFPAFTFATVKDGVNMANVIPNYEHKDFSKRVTFIQEKFSIILNGQAAGQRVATGIFTYTKPKIRCKKIITKRIDET